MLQLGQRITRMLYIRIAHCRVLTQDIHALDLIIMHRIHDFGHGQAFFSAEITRLPDIGKSAAHAVISDRLIIRQKHRDQPRI